MKKTSILLSYPFQCLATIASVYWRSNEESVETERPLQTPAREYSDTILSNSRVEQVHARKRLCVQVARGGIHSQLLAMPLRCSFAAASGGGGGSATGFVPNLLMILMLSVVYAVSGAESTCASPSSGAFHSITAAPTLATFAVQRQRSRRRMRSSQGETVKVDSLFIPFADDLRNSLKRRIPAPVSCSPSERVEFR